MKSQNITPAHVAAVLRQPDGSWLLGKITSREFAGLPNIEIKTAGGKDAALALDQIALTAPLDFSFRSRRLNLAQEAAGLSDVDLAAYLIESAETGVFLGDGKLLLETSLEEQCAQITRLPDDRVLLTEMPRVELDRAAEQVRQLFYPAGLDAERRAAFAAKIPTDNVLVETPLRAALRAFLTESNPSANNFITVFVAASEVGFSVGLWNRACGLFSETSERLPEEFAFEEELEEEFAEEQIEPAAADLLHEEFEADDEITQGFYDPEPARFAAPPPETRQSKSDEIRRNSLSGFLNHALNTAFRTALETIHELGFEGIERVVFAVPVNCQAIAEPIAREKSAEESVDVLLLPEAVESQILRGLLYSQLPGNPLEVANLSRDLYVRLTDNSIAAEQAARDRSARRRRAAAIALLLPFFLLVGFVAGSIFYYRYSSSRLDERAADADAEAGRLAPVLAARNSYVANYKWRESFLRQTLSVKDLQGVAISFLPAVDSKYALASGDSQFSIANIKLDNTGAWSMKGVARNEDRVAGFIQGLEDAENDNDSERVFSNLTFDIKRGAGEKGAVGAPPISSGKTAPSSTLGIVPPGFIGWEIKGVYAPLSAIAGAAKPVAPVTPPPPAAAAPVPPPPPPPPAK